MLLGTMHGTVLRSYYSEVGVEDRRGMIRQFGVLGVPHTSSGCGTCIMVLRLAAVVDRGKPSPSRSRNERFVVR